MELLVVFLVGAGTMVATGLGVIPVFWLGERAESLRVWLIAAAALVMGAASVGLLVPALKDGSVVTVAAGVVIGAVLLLTARRRLAKRGRFSGSHRAAARRSLLVVAVLFVHSFPEGLAVGASWAAQTAALGPFVAIAIALQNVPEGTAVAIPMNAAGYSHSRQFWAAVGTSVPQPFGAVLAYVLVEQVQSLLPFSLAFAAGAMLAVIATEMVPELLRPFRRADAPGERGSQVERGDDAGGAALLVEHDQVPGSVPVHQVGSLDRSGVEGDGDRSAGGVDRARVLT